MQRLQLLCAVVLCAFGCLMLVAGFFCPPLAEIHPTILTAFGEILTFSGALLGMDYKNVPQGLALTGRLYVDSFISEEGHHQYQLSMDTLENLQYAIPDGFYRLRLTYSPRFQELLPLLDNVFGYYSGGSESCRMVQNGVESSSIENTMLHNSTQPLNNATPSAHRTGIRIHAGNTIEHTTGCILVGDLACLENGGDAASTSLIASSPLASSPDRIRMKKSTFNWKALIRILMLILRVITNSNSTSKNRSNEPTGSEKKGDECAKQDSI